MKQQISILGCGWLGMPLALNLLQKGYVIKGSTTSTAKIEKLKSAGIHPFLIEINNLRTNLSDFLDSEILIISIPSKNIDGFKKLIPCIEKAKVRKVLFVSSTSVYDNSNQIVTEAMPTNNSLLNKIEQLFIENKKIESTIIRFGGLFGYDRKPGNFIPLDKKIDNPEGYVNLIHRDDCIRIIEQLLLKDIWGEVFNACADTHPKRRDFYLKETLKERQATPLFNEHSLNAYKIINSEKIKSMLNFTFQYSDLMNY